MNLGCFHQDCVEKLKENLVPSFAGTEGEIRNQWIVACMKDEEVQGIGWNRR